MNLYRIPKGLHSTSGSDVVETLVANGILVLVEPCEHGGYDRHRVSLFSAQLAGYPDAYWCPGAGIGKDNE